MVRKVEAPIADDTHVATPNLSKDGTCVDANLSPDFNRASYAAALNAKPYRWSFKILYGGSYLAPRLHNLWSDASA